ncbi:MAG: hypothetical protein HW400_350 [Candidatus Levybacteria bacterium]|nr:hypothetical protein [Candidatus Levybacteria bacterium]
MKSNNFAETQKLGRDFAKTLKKGDLVCLYGDLGSGKTTFTQGLAEGLGIKQRITSPTFIIVRCYELQTPAFAKASAGKQNLKLFYHVDLYRVESEKDLEGLGIEEIINNKNNIVVIEWAEKLKNYLPRTQCPVRQSVGQLLACKAKNQNAPAVRSWVRGLPKKRIDIKFSYEKDNVRKITFSSSNQ